MVEVTMVELSVEEALERILASCGRRDRLEVASQDAAGLVLAWPVVAPHDLPPFANAGMDGFAVRAADLASASAEHPVRLPVVGLAQAGAAPQPLVPETAVRIMTGAPLPAGAEAIVPLEDAQAQDEGSVCFTAPVASGRHIRPAGEDVAAGELAIPAGRMLRAAEVGLLAALGVTSISVVRRPRVAIISTGDELVPCGQTLGAGQIRDANGPALAVFVAEQGAEPLSLGIARDSHAALAEKLQEAVALGADLILTSAGASAGDYDVVSSLLAEQGALELWRVNLKPGRPMLFGHVGTTPLLGLPGNPASALIVAELFLKPALASMRGLRYQPLTVQAALDQPLRRERRRHYLRAFVRKTAAGYAATTQGIGGGSGSLTTLVRANALLVIPEGASELPAGTLVEALLL